MIIQKINVDKMSVDKMTGENDYRQNYIWGK